MNQREKDLDLGISKLMKEGEKYTAQEVVDHLYPLIKQAQYSKIRSEGLSLNDLMAKLDPVFEKLCNKKVKTGYFNNCLNRSLNKREAAGEDTFSDPSKNYLYYVIYRINGVMFAYECIASNAFNANKLAHESDVKINDDSICRTIKVKP